MHIRKFFSIYAIPLIIFSLITTLCLPQLSMAAVSDWRKGASIVPRWDRDFESDSFKQSIDALAGTNANFVTLIIPYYQSNIYATDIHRGWNTPTDESLLAGIRYIHGKNMGVNLKPHLESYDGQWRAEINPGDRDGWFRAYGDMINYYATLAQNEGVAQLTVGTELIKMTDPQFNGSNTERWYALIAAARERFGGTITYSANWGYPNSWTDEKNHIQFWSAVDVVGISAYYPLPAGDHSPESLRREWHRWNTQDITPFHDRVQKPIEFTEVGYRSQGGARYHPFDFMSGGPESQQEQADLYEALFSYWNDYGFVRGVQLWDWRSDPAAGGGGTEFTPQRKLAEAVMKQWFGGAPPPAQTVGFTASAVANPQRANTGAPVQITTTIQASSAAQNILVDVEVYTSDNRRVHQAFYENQSFTAGQSRAYTTSWTPTESGEYVVRLGVFNSNWTTNYVWEHAAALITVGGSNPTPPPTASEINIWWPTNNSSISGVQPFKAMVPGRELGSYTMYWQVDGGTLNVMDNSDQDYPHKESLVDVSPWRWRGSGPYTVNFVAQDNSGQTIAEKWIQLFIY